MKSEPLGVNMEYDTTDKLLAVFHLFAEVLLIWANIYFATTNAAGFISSMNYVAAILVSMFLVRDYKTYRETMGY